jgi:PAS domain S-box-containing protein
MQSKINPKLDLKKVLYQAVQSDEALFEFIQDRAPDGLWLWDLADRENIWLNDRFGSFLGYEKGGISDPLEAWQQLVHVHDQAKIAPERLEPFLKSDSPHVETVRLFHKTGRWIWMQCHCLLLPDRLGGGKFLLGGVKDLTLERADSAAPQREEIKGPYVIKVDMQGCYLYANDLYHQRFAIEKSSLVGEHALSHIVPEDHDRCLQLVEKCLTQPNVMHRDVLRKPFKGGTYITIEWDFCLLTDSDGNPQEVLCLGYDIDERIKMRKALEKQERLYKSIVSALSEGLVVQDQTDKIVMCNDSASRILGLTKAQLLGKDSYDPRWKALKEDGSLFHPDDHPSMITLRTGQPVDGVIMNVHVGDTKRSIISINSRPILDHQGKLLGAVASFTDITEQKRYEQALQESEATFKAFAAHIPGQVFIKYPSGKHVFGNQRTLDHLEMDLQTYRNSSLFDLFERDYVEYIHGFDEQVHQEKRTIIREFPLTTRGKEEWFQEYKFPINEELIGGFMLDITERKKAENQLMLTNMELSRTGGLLNEAQRLAKMGNFVADLQRETMQASDNLYAMLAIPGKEEYPLSEFLTMIDPCPGDASRIVEHYYQCVAERSNFEAEFSLSQRKRGGNLPLYPGTSFL